MIDPLWKPRRRGRPLTSNRLVRCQVFVPSAVAEFMRGVEPEWAREVLKAAYERDKLDVVDSYGELPLSFDDEPPVESGADLLS